MTSSTRRPIAVAVGSMLTLALGAGLAGVTGGSGSAAVPAPNTVESRTELCAGRGPIPAARLAHGVSTRGCDLTGRVVVADGVSAVVPPAGMGVAGDGVAGEGPDGAAAPDTLLEVTHFDGVVTARVSDHGGLDDQGAGTTEARAADVSACQAGAYALAAGGHRWAKTLKWRYQHSSTPGRWGKWKPLAQIKAGMTNMRTAKDNCGLRGTPRAFSSYLGNSKAAPNIRVRDGRASCGTFNYNNTVGFGSLPPGLLGWTCFWWGGNGNMIATDMRLSPSKKVVLGFSAGCSGKYDLQSLATHEWGHSWGLGHVSNSNLTMHHYLPPCSPKFRTLGLGDWRGMRKLYGLK